MKITKQGKAYTKKIELSELDEDARMEYKRIAGIIEAIATGISLSPIDRIKLRIEQAGYMVAEVTERKLEVRFESLHINIGMVAS